MCLQREIEKQLLQVQSAYTQWQTLGPVLQERFVYRKKKSFPKRATRFCSVFFSRRRFDRAFLDAVVFYPRMMVAVSACRLFDVMSAAQLRSRLATAKERPTPVVPCTAVGTLADLRITVGVNPPPSCCRTLAPSRAPSKLQVKRCAPSSDCLSLT